MAGGMTAPSLPETGYGYQPPTSNVPDWANVYGTGNYGVTDWASSDTGSTTIVAFYPQPGYSEVKTIWREDVMADAKILKSTWSIWNENYVLQTGMDRQIWISSDERNRVIDRHLEDVHRQRVEKGINEPVKTHADLEREATEEAARVEEQRLANIRYEEEQRKKKEELDKAEKVAKKLLKELISQADYELYLKEGYVEVEGRKGRAYRIRPGQTIDVWKGGAHEHSLCIVTKDTRLPAADEVIWKKLMVEADEKGLLKIGNRQN